MYSSVLYTAVHCLVLYSAIDRTALRLTEQEVPECLPEVWIEDGVDDRVEGGVEVPEPGDEVYHLKQNRFIKRSNIK